MPILSIYVTHEKYLELSRALPSGIRSVENYILSLVQAQIENNPNRSVRDARSSILNLIKSNNGISSGQLTRKHQWLKKWERDEVVANLVTEGLISVVKEPQICGAGRPIIRYYLHLDSTPTPVASSEVHDSQTQTNPSWETM